MSYEEVLYEGYASGGVAVMVETVTDNKNRTVSDVRYVFNKHGGSLAGAGAVAYLFNKKGVLTFSKEDVDEEKLMELALEAGAEDISEEEESFEVLTDQGDLDAVREALVEAGLEPESAELAMLPATTIGLDMKGATSIAKIIEAFEDCDDVQNVWTNAEFPEDYEEE